MNLEQIKKAKEGDVEETAKIILENNKSMYRVAFSILKSEEEIYDAIANTTVIVFEKISTLKKEEFFKSIGVRIELTIISRITEVKYLLSSISTSSPFLETIRATSPLVIIPTPILRASLPLNPQTLDISPHPMIFDISPTRTKPRENKRIVISRLLRSV